MNKEILLIGGSGYVGSEITKYFLSKKDKVTCIDNLIYKQTNQIHFTGNPDFKFNFFDIRSENVFDNEILEKVENVIILAGLVGDPVTKKYQKLHTEINDHGIKKIINSLANFQNIKNAIFISTCSNYGLMKEGEIADESSILNPISLYAQAKVDNELFFQDSNLKCKKTILRFATAFGMSSRMRFDLTINEFVKNLYLYKRQEVYDEDTWRPYCHIIDFARTIEAVINDKKEWDTEIFNVGSDINNFTKKMICEKISKFVKSAEIIYTGKSNDKRNYKVSFDKLKKILNFEAKYSVEFGISQIIEAFQSGIFQNQNLELFGNYSIKNDN